MRAAPQQQRSAAKVAAILAAARRLLQEQPAEAVTTASIAAEAGVPVASLYRYFADVSEILDVLVAEHAAASADALEAALTADRSTTVAGAYLAAVDAHLRLYAERPELTRVWHSPQLAERQRALEAASDDALAARVGRHLVERGLLSRLTPTAIERLQAHWATCGTLLGTVLRTTGPRRQVLTEDLRATARLLGDRW